MSLSNGPGLDPRVIPYFPPARRKGRTAAVAIVAALVIAATALLAGWWFIAVRLDDGVDAFIARTTQDGGHFTAVRRAHAGFPFHPTVVLTKPEIAFPPGAPGSWSWSGDKVTVSVPLFAPNVIDIALIGGGRLQAMPFGQSLDLAIAAETARARLSQEPGRETAVVTVNALAIAAPDGTTLNVDQATLTLTRATTAPRDEHTQGYGLSLALRGLTLPDGVNTPLGRNVGQLAVDAAVLGPLTPALDTKAFTAWRNSGGTLQIAQLTARFGPLTIALDATLALDGGLQPIGAGTGRIQGFAPALDALAASQAIRLNDANAAKSFLTLLARPPTPGAEPQLTAPLTIQERKLFIGPIALMSIPLIDWPVLEPVPSAAPETAPEGQRTPNDVDQLMPAPPASVEMPEGR